MPAIAPRGRQHKEPPRVVEMRPDADAHAGALPVPDSIVVSRNHPEPVVARGQVHIDGRAGLIGFPPVAVEPLQQIPEPHLRGHQETGGREAELDGSGVRADFDPARAGRAFLAISRDGFDVYGRRQRIGENLAWIHHDHAAHGREPQFSVPGLPGGGLKTSRALAAVHAIFLAVSPVGDFRHSPLGKGVQVRAANPQYAGPGAQPQFARVVLDDTEDYLLPERARTEIAGEPVAVHAKQAGAEGAHPQDAVPVRVERGDQFLGQSRSARHDFPAFQTRQPVCGSNPEPPFAILGQCPDVSLRPLGVRAVGCQPFSADPGESAAGPHPEVAVAGAQKRHHRAQRGTRGGEGLEPAVPIPAQSPVVRTHPQAALAVRGQRPDAVVGEAVAAGEHPETAALQTAQASAVGPGPDHSVRGLVDGHRGVIAEALARAVGGESRVAQSNQASAVGAHPELTFAILEQGRDGSARKPARGSQNVELSGIEPGQASPEGSDPEASRSTPL